MIVTGVRIALSLEIERVSRGHSRPEVHLLSLQFTCKAPKFLLALVCNNCFNCYYNCDDHIFISIYMYC